MHVLYEDNGGFKAGRIFSEGESTMQVEAESGKRSKIKNASVLFRFDQPAPAALLEQAQALADTLETDFLWECAPQEEFLAADFAEDYFGHPPSAVEKAALIFALHNAPAYFHRRGKGGYRPAPPDILAAALAAIDKKRKQAEQQQEWTDALVAHHMPAPIAEAATDLLIRPDKNSMQWKALDAAVKQLATTPEKLLLEAGAWPHPLALHRARFLAANFPHGTTLPPVEVGTPGGDLPLSDVIAYSVDDISTTEVDDAISVTMQGDDRALIGIHIAVPALAVTRDNPLDRLARERMSTVYAPGQKIPMLPDALIEAFSLDEGKPRPALSLYVQADLGSGEILSSETRLERIQVRENLRHNHLDELITEEALDDPGADLPYGEWLRPLWRFARHLATQREQVRGKPENNNRIDYQFYLEGPADDPDARVILAPRRRNAPLDRLVAEYMILTNNLWGGLLARHGVPGIYRSQQAGRVRMSTQALPHEAIGVPQYAWTTSPLRRYVDLINQGQLLATVEHGVSARLVAPFKPKDADLFAIIGAFDSQYAIWGDYQTAMERYWCMRWLQQQGLRRVRATVIRDDLARLDCAPLVTRVSALPALERGQAITLDISGYDELNLEMDCRYVETVSD
ncbi:MAG TPA: ribonuclease catalytic domain-containing protein [Burkholderiaceae bacterium]|nr:ribonuclease catalytic domain-containing protein [Burkholderiaceae bacterium]